MVFVTCTFIFVLRKKGSKTKKRMKEEEIEKGDCGPPTRKVFFEILSDLNQAVPNHFFFFFLFFFAVPNHLAVAVPNHLADESQTR